MHLYLHIGAEKTGTTAIQRFLQINRRQLEAKAFSSRGRRVR
jgi:hypothetical protein